MNIYQIWLTFALFVVAMSFVCLFYADRNKGKLLPKVKSFLDTAALLGFAFGLVVGLNVMYDLMKLL